MWLQNLSQSVLGIQFVLIKVNIISLLLERRPVSKDKDELTFILNSR